MSMNQCPLILADADPATHGDPASRDGFAVGWDQARHGLVPAADLLRESTPLDQGWRAGRAVFGRRSLACTRTTRLWLQLRTQAWRQQDTFDGAQVTPEFLAQIHTHRCPVLRVPLGGAAGDADAAVVQRLDPRAGYVAGNLVVMSQHAAQALVEVDVREASRRFQQARASGRDVRDLAAPAWARLATLRAFAMPLSFAEATQLPLAVLPPVGVQPVNTAQRLQAALTLQFTAPGWSGRTRALGTTLPEPALRHDFNLFVGAMAARVLEAGHERHLLRMALEDAWLHERVHRRWQHFLLNLGEAGTATLLQRAGAPAPEAAHVRFATAAWRSARRKKDSPAGPSPAGECWRLQAPGTGSGAPPSVAVGYRLSQTHCPANHRFDAGRTAG
jgi:hypothetical protein